MNDMNLVHNLAMAILETAKNSSPHGWWKEEEVKDTLAKAGLVTKKDYKKYDLLDLYEELTAHDYLLNKLYRESGIRFYEGRKLIRELWDNTYCCGHITGFTVDRSKAEANSALLEEMDIGYGWCEVVDALKENPDGTKFKYVERYYVDQSKEYGYDWGYEVPSHYEKIA